MPAKQPRPHNGLKFFLSLGLIVGSTAYALWQQNASAALITPTTSAPPPTGAGSSVAVTPAPTPIVTAPAPKPTPAPKPKGQYVDGTYTGSVADAYYGLVQVQAVVQGGKLVDLKFLQYPSDRSTSRYINGQAMPLLTQEAISAQSAHVNGVSGASDTSAAFVQSLGAALTQAKA